ncbi:MAG: phage major capsid protein, P2 family [Desulfobacter sp.]|nr:phage major capsid protein, P2 family [Desulfobacter sp.]
MKDLTRQKLDQMGQRIAKGYGVVSVGKTFAATPTIEQKLQDKIVEKDTFLPLINIVPVDEMEGKRVFGSASSPVSGRTNTSTPGKEREPKNVLGLDEAGYKLYKTDSDVYLDYETMDSWAKFPDLADRYTGYVQERIAKDRTTIGWYGETAEADTDLEANPLMQDVNIGWIQYMRANHAAKILTAGTKEAGQVRIGAGGDFVNLDHAVIDLLQGIPVFLRSDLITLAGSKLVAAEQIALFQSLGQKPTEKTLANTSLTLFGGLPWMTPTNFPGRGLVITSLKNLSIYHQSGSWRRRIVDAPKKDRVEDYNSRNEGYVVETPEKFVGLEFKNVKLLQADGTTWA